MSQEAATVDYGALGGSNSQGMIGGTLIATMLFIAITTGREGRLVVDLVATVAAGFLMFFDPAKYLNTLLGSSADTGDLSLTATRVQGALLVGSGIAIARIRVAAAPQSALWAHLAARTMGALCMLWCMLTLHLSSTITPTETYLIQAIVLSVEVAGSLYHMASLPAPKTSTLPKNSKVKASLSRHFFVCLCVATAYFLVPELASSGKDLTPTGRYSMQALCALLLHSGLRAFLSQWGDVAAAKAATYASLTEICLVMGSVAWGSESLQKAWLPLVGLMMLANNLLYGLDHI